MIKCVIWDLDDTVWNGILQHENVVSVNSDIIELIIKLDKLGIIQSCVSKNNFSETKKKLEEIGIFDYFIYPQIDFNHKWQNISKIINRINILPENTAFIDDSKFELYSVNKYLPEVLTFFPSESNMVLELVLNNEDKIFTKNRRNLMQIREQRLLAKEKFSGSHDEFLKSCEMKLTIKNADRTEVLRIYELVGRTNKLNNLLSRLDVSEIEKIILSPNYITFTVNLNDIFGDHDVVGIAIFEKNDDCLHLKLFCISCRIEGRGIGTAFLNYVINYLSAKLDIKTVLCEYKNNKNNAPALILIKLLGFQFANNLNGDLQLYKLALPNNIKNVEWIKTSYE